MREIKFRAWDKENKYMVNFESHKTGIIYTNGKLLVNSGYDGMDRPTFEESKVDSHIVMQSTGLKDKNGVEIYEGDICRIYFDVDKVEDWVHLSLTKKEIDSGAKIFQVESPLFNNQVEFTADIIEIVGNIFQHPYLLEEK